ncbi:MAG: hypothetical protein HOM11_08375 [Methylococcales bacterium]|jgi:hypothetical protein|nr:hypothetical protein [Methylococcales bacterium]MBT7445320.1 hypothetical protein [Methylococcales bacterium]
MPILWKPFYVLLGMLVTMPVLALGFFGEEEGYSGYVEPDPWKEAFTKIPEYLDDDRLLELSIDLINTPFTYWIDPESIQEGTDEVVRYMILLRSSTGSENAFYEGIRCDTMEFKTYAYGVGKRFQAKRNQQWMPIRNSGSVRYRAELFQHYLCENKLPLDKDQIIRNIKYPS